MRRAFRISSHMRSAVPGATRLNTEPISTRACWAIACRLRPCLSVVGMVCRPHPRGSELYAQRELDDARSPRGYNLAELAVLLLALRIEKGEAVDCVELRVVECVIEFRSELQRTTVAPQRKFLHQRNVEVGLTRAVNGSDRRIA